MNRREFVKDSLALAGAAAIGLGCSKETTAKEGSSTPQSSENKGEKKMKDAVVYYSWSGNTRFAAETIAKKAGADLFEIKAEKPYNSAVSVSSVSSVANATNSSVSVCSLSVSASV